jgi:hypothetical protein
VFFHKKIDFTKETNMLSQTMDILLEGTNILFQTVAILWVGDRIFTVWDRISIPNGKYSMGKG